jgi:hypothetical protein
MRIYIITTFLTPHGHQKTPKDTKRHQKTPKEYKDIMPGLCLGV